MPGQGNLFDEKGATNENMGAFPGIFANYQN